MMVLGLDIGGANIKAANSSGRAISRPFELWKQPDQLEDELTAILQEFPQTERVALTMTAELADCFSTKTEGVRFILDSVDGCIRKAIPANESIDTQPSGNVAVWSTDGRFVSSIEARLNVFKVAAANWHALATWCGSLVPTGSALLIDIGTTTTDIIPIVDGKPVPVGLTDVMRLQSGELSYSGVWRTPLCAVAHSVPFRDGYCSLAAELFSTMLDVYLLLGNLPEDPEYVGTANGRPATKADAHDRIVRMLCCDRHEIPMSEAVQIAKFLADVQRQRIAGALERVAHRLSSPCQSVIISGSGNFLAYQLAFENRHTTNCKIISLAKEFSAEVAEAACAHAVALLASQSK